MDSEEYRIRLQEIQLREREVTDNADHNKRTRKLTLWSVVGSIVAIAATVGVSLFTLGEQSLSATQAAINSNQQSAATNRLNYYLGVIAALGSDSSASQAFAIRNLVEYVEDLDNFNGKVSDQQAAVHDALQVLSTFIRQQSGAHGNVLTDYEVFQSGTVDQALSQIVALSQFDDHQQHDVDISFADLHGLSIEEFSPKGPLHAELTDFRRASLRNLHISHGVNFTGAILTCADLSHSELSGAVFEEADLSGADLTDADLSGVQGLDATQLTGARISSTTRLPAGIDAKRLGPAWLDQKYKCSRIVRAMTGMARKQGYSPFVPCPVSEGSWKENAAALAPFEKIKSNLLLVCSARAQTLDDANVG